MRQERDREGKTGGGNERDNRRREENKANRRGSEKVENAGV